MNDTVVTLGLPWHDLQRSLALALAADPVTVPAPRHAGLQIPRTLPAAASWLVRARMQSRRSR
jgi:hypothetical protein